VGRSQGILLSRPITRFSAMAAMMERIIIDRVVTRRI
jgi:hypothetical protein